MKDIAKNLIEELKAVTDNFYQNQNQKGIKVMPEIIRKLSEFASYLKPEEQQEFLTILTSAMEAMETKNYIMLADILIFDVVNVIERY